MVLPPTRSRFLASADITLRRRQIEESSSSEEQKRVDRMRLNALVALCKSPRCRRQTLLRYFGETIGPCGNCDVCSGGVEVIDGTIAAQKAMSAILRTGERFGTEHLVDLLRGEETDAIKNSATTGCRPSASARRTTASSGARSSASSTPPG